MTDKQIIIDGIDVSKCIYFQQEDDEYTCGAEECNGAIVACRACDNCYYKQLKRKEQECETLASQLDFEVQKKECLEQECEELKDIIETKLENANICDTALNYINDEYIYVKRQLDQLKEANEDLLNVQYKLADNNKKLRQTLAEIKEMLIKTPTDSREHFLNAKSVILQICDEVNDVK